jgi:protein-S-isoprenylcysteine O-methyltransferase Ste14
MVGGCPVHPRAGSADFGRELAYRAGLAASITRGGADPRSLTPLDDATLVQTGAYAIVRHPIYSGVVFGVLGWALVFNSLIGLALAVVVLVFFDQKSRREEAWLKEKYPDYSAYRQRVHRLIPFIY